MNLNFSRQLRRDHKAFAGRLQANRKSTAIQLQADCTPTVGGDLGHGRHGVVMQSWPVTVHAANAQQTLLKLQHIYFLLYILLRGLSYYRA